MRIVLLPETQLPNPYSDSEFRGWLGVARAMLERHDDLFVYFVAPETAMGKVKPEKGIKFLFADRLEPFVDLEATTPASFYSLFGTRNGEYPIDAVVTSRSAIGAVLSRQLWDYRHKDDLVPVIIEESKATDFGEAHMTVSDVGLIARTLSYAVSWPVFHSEWERETAMSAARRYLNPATAKKVLGRSVVIPVWFNHRRIDGVVQGVQKHEQFTVFFGGRLNEAKRGNELLEIYDRFYKFGRPVKVVICSPRAEQRTLPKWKEQYPHFEFYTALSGEDFYRKAAASHVYLNTSAHEGFSMGFIEQLYMGLVGIFPDAPWTRAILGDELVDAYPFAYRSLEEAAVHLRRVYKEYEQAREQVRPLPSLLKEKYGRPELQDALYRHVKAVVESRDLPALPVQTVDLVRRALKRVGRPLTLRALYATASHLSLGFHESPTRGQPSRWDVYKWLLKHGFQDLCDGPEPRFVERDRGRQR